MLNKQRVLIAAAAAAASDTTLDMPSEAQQ